MSRARATPETTRLRDLHRVIVAFALALVFTACGARTPPELDELELDRAGRSGATGGASGAAAGNARGGTSAGTASGAAAGTAGSGGQPSSGGASVGGAAGVFGGGGTPASGGTGGVVTGGGAGVAGVAGVAGIAGESGDAGGAGDAGASGAGAGGQAGEGGAIEAGGRGGEDAQGGAGGSTPRATGLALAAFHTCANFENGSVRCWGSGGYIGRGDTETIGDDEPASAAGDVDVGGAVTQLSAGWYQTCALLEGGRVRCWGNGYSGLLGYGHTNDIGDDETPASAGDVNVGGSVRHIAAGGSHTCACLSDGNVRCWGRNDNFQLGHSAPETLGDDEVPAAAGLVDVGGVVVQLAAGRVHTCALLDTGKVRCWGEGGGGRLGYASVESIGDDETPAFAGDVDVGGTVIQIVAGLLHTCALLDTGGVRCWGVGSNGVLGYGNTDTIGDDETPASAGDIELGGAAVQLAGGDWGTCALLTTGAVRCWGDADSGELGYGSVSDIGDDETPASAGDVDVGGPVVAIDMGFLHTCAILESGNVRCWGRGGTAALGYGNSADIGDDETPASAGDVETH